MKSLKDQTLLNKFLFDETMDRKEAHEALLQIVLGNEDLHLKEDTQTEKELRNVPDRKSVRLDVYAKDEKDNVYNTEMQAQFRKDLRRRTRFYQSQIDSSMIESGSKSYNDLKDSYIIMIMPFDLFGKGKYCYTFRNRCVEIPELDLTDGATRIILNTRGTNDDEVSDELVALLHYIETTDGAIAEQSDCERLKLIHHCVEEIKASEDAGGRFMTRIEEIDWACEEARENGLAEGRAEGRAEGITEGIVEGQESLILSALQAGTSVKDLAAALHVEEETVQKIWEKVQSRK